MRRSGNNVRTVSLSATTRVFAPNMQYKHGCDEDEAKHENGHRSTEISKHILSAKLKGLIDKILNKHFQAGRVLRIEAPQAAAAHRIASARPHGAAAARCGARTATRTTLANGAACACRSSRARWTADGVRLKSVCTRRLLIYQKM